MIISLKNSIRFLAILILVVLLPVFSTFGQDLEIKFQKFSTEDGLNQNSVLDIFQDEDGFLWIGTYAGLNRYDGYNFKSYKHNYINAEQVRDMHIRSICADTEEVLLIGTTSGVTRFFKHTEEFVNFSHNPEDSTSLAHNTVYKVIKDRDGDIWVATAGGGLDKMERIDSAYTDERKAKYRFIHYKPEDKPGSISSLAIADMAEGPDGTIWLATNKGLNRFDKHTNIFTVYTHNPKDPNSISSDDVSAVYPDKDGIIWVGTWEGGLNRFDPNTGIFQHFKHNPKSNHSLSHNIIMSLNCDSRGDLWVGTWGGGLNRLVCENESGSASMLPINEQSVKFIRYTYSSSNNSSLSGNSIYSIYEDRAGNMWVGTDWAGLNKFHINAPKFRHIFAEQSLEDNFISNIVYSLLLDSEDKLWIGTEQGVNIYNRATNEFQLFQSNPGDPSTISHNHVRTIIMDSNNQIWLGTENGLNRYLPETNSFKPYNSIFTEGEKALIISLHEDKNGELWIGTYGVGLYKFNPLSGEKRRYTHTAGDSTSLSDNIIWDIEEDSTGNIWLATAQGLCRYDSKKQVFSTHKYQVGNASNLSSDLVISLYFDKLQNLWVGTRHGLNKLAKDELNDVSPNFTRYSAKSGLSSPTINGIIEDNNGVFWLTTTRGLTRYNPKSDKFSSFYLEDGLQGNEFSINAVEIDRETGELYIGGINGFNMFFPDQIMRESRPSVTRIVDFRLFHQSVEAGDTINNEVVLHQDVAYTNQIELPYDNYVISFEYAALQFHDAFSTQYAYKLEGFEKEWNQVQNVRVATYRNLPPGHYTFLVQAATKDGEWYDTPTSLKLFLKPPWWNTLLFKIFAVLLLISAILSIYFLRVKILKKRQYQLEETVSKRTEELSEVNVLLEEKQEEISLQNEELRKHRFELEKLVDARTAQLTAAKRKAEESDKLKSAFLANMSHEIRTPMNAIIGFSNLLVDDRQEPEEQEFLAKMIRVNGNTLLTLINDIIDISIIEANQLVLHKNKFCVDDIMSEVHGIFKLRSKEAVDLQIVLNDNTTKTYIKNDQIRFRQVLTNLVGNALKFTEEGYVRLGYQLKGKRIEVFVEDTGIGIRNEDHATIFEPFRKIEPSKTKLYEGTGIGLAICKKLVELMGGELKLISEPGKGAKFFFTLPLTEISTSESSAPGAQDSNRVPDFSKFDIIVAEDEDNNYKLLQYLLRKTQANIAWAKNGKEAVEMVENRDKSNKCLILMDIKMPVMNGIDAQKQIAKLEKDLPVIAVTAYAQASDRQKLLKQGFASYLSKPINAQELYKILQQYAD